MAPWRSAANIASSFSARARPARSTSSIVGGRHDRHPVGVADEPVPRRHRHPAHLDGRAHRSGAVLRRTAQRHRGGEHRETVGLEAAVSRTPPSMTRPAIPRDSRRRW